MKNTPVRVGIVAFGVFVVGMAYWVAHRPPDPPEVVRARISVSREIAQKAVAAVGNQERWTAVTIDDAKPTGYFLTIHFAAPPRSDQVEADTRALARAVLLQLTLAGRHASDSGTQIAVNAMQGDDLAVLGTASFVPARDTIVFATAR